MVKPNLWQRMLKTLQFADESTEISIRPTPLVTRAPVGVYGTVSYAGYPSEDYLQQMRGRQRADIFDQMRRSDAQIKMCLSSVKNPLKSACWEIEPGSIDGVVTDEAKADAELIEHILFEDMQQPWVDFISEALTMYDFGHSVFEPIHKVVLNHRRFGSYNGIKTLAFRSQRTLERWNLDPDTGDLVSITQYSFGDLNRQVDIPARNLLVFTLEKEGANYEGISALRPCYGPWFRKDNYLKLNAIGIEKFAIPTPLVEMPSDIKPSSTQYNNMIAVLEHYLTHQKNYLLYPTGVKVTLNTNTYDPEKVESSINNEDKRMVKSFLANFLELGMDTTGSYAMSNNLSDFFLSGLDYVASKIEGPINRVLIPSLIQMNRGQRDVYPYLKHSGVSDKAGKELAEILKYLSDSRVIVPDNVLEEHVRERYKFPQASTEGRREAPAQPGVGGFNPSMSLAEQIHLAEFRRKKILA